LLVPWEEVDRPFFILHLQVLVVANEVALLGQLEDVLDVANRASDLTSCDVQLLVVSN